MFDRDALARNTVPQSLRTPVKNQKSKLRVFLLLTFDF